MTSVMENILGHICESVHLLLCFRSNSSISLQWWNEKCNEIEELERKHKNNEMHAKVKEMSTKKGSKSGTNCIRDKNGKMLFDSNDVINRWVEHVTELYHDERGDPPYVSNQNGCCIMKSEIENVITEMKCGKASGNDDIATEMIKGLDDKCIKKITELCNLVYDTGYLPPDMSTSLFVRLPKKAKATECSDYRTLSLAETEEDLQEILNEVNRIGKTFDMKMNGKKTKTMLVSKDVNSTKVSVKIDGDIIKQSNNYTYMGQTITSNGKCDDEILKRIEIERGAFNSMLKTFNCSTHKYENKKNNCKSMWSTLLYGCETWTISTRYMKKLQSFEMRAYRKMKKISWRDKITN